MRIIRIATNNQKLKFVKGFTLIELLVVMAILAIMAIGITPKVVNFYNSYELDASTQDLIQVFRLAQTRAMQSEASGTTTSPYSVHLVLGQGGSFTLYRGTVYDNTRDKNYDESHTIIGSLVLSYNNNATSTDITFSKIEGTTTSTGTTTISWPDGNLSKSFTMNSFGVITRN